MKSLSIPFVLSLAASHAFVPTLASGDDTNAAIIPVETAVAGPAMDNLMERIVRLSNRAIPVNTIPEEIKARGERKRYLHLERRVLNLPAYSIRSDRSRWLSRRRLH